MASSTWSNSLIIGIYVAAVLMSPLYIDNIYMSVPCVSSLVQNPSCPSRKNNMICNHFNNLMFLCFYRYTWSEMTSIKSINHSIWTNPVGYSISNLLIDLILTLHDHSAMHLQRESIQVHKPEFPWRHAPEDGIINSEAPWRHHFMRKFSAGWRRGRKLCRIPGVFQCTWRATHMGFRKVQIHG